MDRNNHLLLLANKVEQAYKNWQNHPKDHLCQKQYEMAKANLDSEIKKCKDISYLKHPH
jgi:hypothetical protein